MSARIPRLLLTAVAAGLAVAACASADVDTTTSPTSTTSPASTTTTINTTGGTVPAVPAVPEGFGVVPALVTPPAGEPCEVCLWLADADDLRRRGLMGVTDLGGPDGMAFVYDEPRTTSFTMRNTLMELSIAFYDAEGTYLDAFDMEPCRAEPCTSYPTPPGFTVAVEVRRGELEQLAMVPGSRLELTPLAGHCDTPSSH